jgi:hypothetical protein
MAATNVTGIANLSEAENADPGSARRMPQLCISTADPFLFGSYRPFSTLAIKGIRHTRQSGPDVPKTPRKKPKAAARGSLNKEKHR